MCVCVCVKYFQLPTFPPFCLIVYLRTTFQISHITPVLLEKKKGQGECVCACVRACLCVYSRISNRPHFPDLTGHDWFARIASCPHSSWTLSALASTLSCPFLPSKLGHKCACSALEVARSSQFMLRHTCLCMHAEWNCPECPQCVQKNKNVQKFAQSFPGPTHCKLNNPIICNCYKLSNVNQRNAHFSL